MKLSRSAKLVRRMTRAAIAVIQLKVGNGREYSKAKKGEKRQEVRFVNVDKINCLALQSTKIFGRLYGNDPSVVDLYR